MIISTESEWTFETIQKYDEVIAGIAAEYGLDTYPNQIEIISLDQMIDAYASIGMPIGYNHWSFGKDFVNIEKDYKRGHMGLAYELVINSNPCIAYLMEENTMTMQALVIAHACYGHNSFFKNNYLFKTWTDAESIIDYLLFAKKYISECEEIHGVEKVEELLDSCHALMNYGVDKYKRPQPISASEEKLRLKERQDYIQRNLNDLWRTIPGAEKEKEEKEELFPKDPEENILYFIEKNAPLLEVWEREIIRIVRKIAQYFYPQRQTQVMNEGWACFWHYKLTNELYDRGYVDESFMIEFLSSHTAVIFQPSFDHPAYSGLNPYTLGFSIFSDIYRICTEPTEEDREWFPEIAGSDWKKTMFEAMENYKDESFILQFLSPKVMRDMKLFAVVDDDKKKEIEIAAIHDSEGYREVRELLAKQKYIGSYDPNIQIKKVDLKGDRSLTLEFIVQDRRSLEEGSREEMLKHLYRLWKFPIHLDCVHETSRTTTYSCPKSEEKKEITGNPFLDIGYGGFILPCHDGNGHSGKYNVKTQVLSCSKDFDDEPFICKSYNNAVDLADDFIGDELPIVYDVDFVTNRLIVINNDFEIVIFKYHRRK